METEIERMEEAVPETEEEEEEVFPREESHVQPSKTKLIPNKSTRTLTQAQPDTVFRPNQQAEQDEDFEEEDLTEFQESRENDQEDEERWFDVDQVEVPVNRQALKKAFQWFKEEEKDGQSQPHSRNKESFIPVQDSSLALREMVSAREELDRLLSSSSLLESKSQANQLVCSKTIQLNSFLNSFSSPHALSTLLSHSHNKPTVIWLTGNETTNSSGNGEQEQEKNELQAALNDAVKKPVEVDRESVLQFLRSRVVQVNGGTRRRVTNLSLCVQTIRKGLVANDVEGRFTACLPQSWMTFVAQTLRLAALADVFVAALLTNNASTDGHEWMKLSGAFAEYLASRKGTEREIVLEEVCSICGDILWDSVSMWFPREQKYSNGIRVTSKSVLIVQPSGEHQPQTQQDLQEKLQIKFQLNLECSLDSLAQQLINGGGVSADTFHISLSLSQNTGEGDTRFQSDDGNKSTDKNESKRNQDGKGTDEIGSGRGPEMLMRKDVARLMQTSTNPSAISAQVFSWGRNESSVLGIGSSELAVFRTASPVPLWGVLEYTRVSKLSCGWYHCAALSDMGLLFTWGSGATGALGHGDWTDVDVPRMVELSQQAEGQSTDGEKEEDEWVRKTPILMIDVACGSELLGSHTACVSRDGALYTWGYGPALGHGSTNHSAVPNKVDQGEFDDRLIDGVACGGGFTVALCCDGTMYSWGTWLHGRLGLGIPDKRSFSRRGFRSGTNDERKSFQRFCLRPRKIQGVVDDKEIVQVACGEAHALAVDRQGKLYAWGKGSHGQLGVGTLTNAMKPVKVENYLDEKESVLRKLAFISKVACGANHSLAVDRKDRLLSWGGLGGPCLGLGASTTNWAVQVNGAFVVNDSSMKSSSNNSVSQSVNDESELAGDEQRPFVLNLEDEQPWRWPSVVTGVKGEKWRCISGGVKHSAAVSASGTIYLWGEHVRQDGSSCAEPRLVQDRVLSGQFAELISCGGWHTTVATIGAKSCVDLETLLDVNDFHASLTNLAVQVEPDLQICVGAKNLYAHRVIVAARSAELKRMIELEGLRTAEDKDEFTKIALPEVSYHGGRILLEYLYRDNIYSRLDPLDTVVDEVMILARRLGLKRLEVLCARSQAVSGAGSEDSEDEMDEEEEEEKETKEIKGRAEAKAKAKTYRETLLSDENLLTSTLNDDLARFINEPTWADIVFKTSDKRKLFAHSAVILPRCPYFASAWKRKASDTPVLHLSVSEEQSLFLRFLAFVYADKTLSSTPEELFEDIEMAYKYNMPSMLTRSQDSLQMSSSVALRALLLGRKVGSSSLTTRALHFIAQNLDELSQTKSFLRLQRSSPEVLEDILRQARASSCFKRIYTEKGVLAEQGTVSEDDPVRILKLVLKTEEQREKERLEKENAQLFSTGGLSWTWIFFLAFFAISYSFVITTPSMLAVVPVANAFILIGIVAGVGYALAS